MGKLITRQDVIEKNVADLTKQKDKILQSGTYQQVSGKGTVKNDNVIDQQVPTSSWMRLFTYFKDNTLMIDLAGYGGKLYAPLIIEGITPTIYNEWLTSPSAGKYWHSKIKNSWGRFSRPLANWEGQLGFERVIDMIHDPKKLIELLIDDIGGDLFTFSQLRSFKDPKRGLKNFEDLNLYKKGRDMGRANFGMNQIKEKAINSVIEVKPDDVMNKFNKLKF